MGGSLQLNIAHKMQLKYIGQGDRLKYDGGRPDLTCEMCDSPTSQSVSVFFPRKKINADNLTPATLTSPSDATYVSSQARRLSETQYVFFLCLAFDN